jgi:hypothetical protein
MRVFRVTDDGNDLIIIAAVADLAKAKQWAAGADLKGAMEKAGVLGAPSIRFFD